MLWLDLFKCDLLNKLKNPPQGLYESLKVFVTNYCPTIY